MRLKAEIPFVFEQRSRILPPAHIDLAAPNATQRSTATFKRHGDELATIEVPTPKSRSAFTLSTTMETKLQEQTVAVNSRSMR